VIDRLREREGTIPTPEIKANHPLQYDPEFHQIVVGAQRTNGIMSAYTRAGKKIGSLTVSRFDQCNLDPSQHILAWPRRRHHAHPAQADAVPVILDTVR